MLLELPSAAAISVVISPSSAAVGPEKSGACTKHDVSQAAEELSFAQHAVAVSALSQLV